MSLSKHIRTWIEEPIREFQILRSERIGSHIQKVTLAFAQNDGPFPVGSYVQFVIEGVVPRAYSVADSTVDTCTIIVSFGGMGVGSRYFAGAPTGTQIRAYGPYDDFPYHKGNERTKLFLATGTGVAPFVRMIRSAIKEGVSSALLLGSPTEGDLPYHSYFQELADTSKNEFTYFPVLSKPHNKWQGGKGYITRYLPQLFQEYSMEHCDVYVCGVPIMVYDVKRLLKRVGFPKQQLFIQEFR